METDLRELLGTVQNRHLRRLLGLVFRPGSSMWAKYRDAPAAKYYHQAYRHGLLEHCLTVAQAVSAISATFPGIDRDVAVTGALLHDLGKLDAYDLDGDAISMSDHGRLYGEIPLGYYLVRRLIERIDGFPADLEQAVLHIILSHHGALEHGSPVVPCTREATLVHMIDNLGGRLGSFDRLERAPRRRAVVGVGQGPRWRGVLRRSGGAGAAGGVGAGVLGSASRGGGGARCLPRGPVLARPDAERPAGGRLCIAGPGGGCLPSKPSARGRLGLKAQGKRVGEGFAAGRQSPPFDPLALPKSAPFVPRVSRETCIARQHRSRRRALSYYPCSSCFMRQASPSGAEIVALCRFSGKCGGARPLPFPRRRLPGPRQSRLRARSARGLRVASQSRPRARPATATPPPPNPP